MYFPSTESASASAADAASGGGPGEAAAAPLQLFGNDGLVPAASAAPAAAARSEERGSPLVPLLVAAAVTLLLHGLLLLAASAGLPAGGADRFLLTVQWLCGALLVLPVGYALHRLTGRTTPAVAAAAVLALHPGVLSATLLPGGPFWALAAVGVAVFLLFGGVRDAADGRRPVAGLAPCAAAGLVLGAGGLIALPVAALAAPLGLWRLLRGLGCAGPGRGPRDGAAAVVLVAAAAIPLAGFHAADGDSAIARRLAAPHGEVIPRLIEHRWPQLLDRFGLAPGLDLTGELRRAFEPPPADGTRSLPSPASALPEPGLFDAAASSAWNGVNALLLCGSLAAAGLAVHRRRFSLGLLMLLAVPAAVVAGGPSGEALRLSLLPVQLLLLSVFWLPPRRFSKPSAAFQKPVADAGFTIGQNTPRAI